MNHSKQQPSKHHQRQHSDHKRGSPKELPPRRKTCKHVLVAQSRILSFYPGVSPTSQNSSDNKAIVSYNLLKVHGAPMMILVIKHNLYGPRLEKALGGSEAIPIRLVPRRCLSGLGTA
jgi:hypothetical protein